MIRTLTDSELQSVVVDGMEVTLDAVLSEGPLRDVPIISTLVGVAKTGHRVSEELFLRKLVRFLQGIEGVPLRERRKLSGRPDDLHDLGEDLLLAIERLDRVQKPRILARFFAAYVQGEIDNVTFWQLARALERFDPELYPPVVG